MSYVIEILKAVVLGIVQGITEWLPVSSTGHMILVDEFLQLQGSDAFVSTFLVVIQLGSIMAVVVLYWNKLWPFSRKKTVEQRRKTWNLWFHVLVACIPAGIVGILLDDYIDSIFYNPTCIAIALIVYGIAFIVIENMHIEKKITKTKDIDYGTSLKIGGFQMLALIPGTSRSGSTIIGGSLLGVDRKAISEFSFFMAIPVMAGASLLKIVKNGLAFTAFEWAVMLVGALVAFIVSVLCIRLFMNYIRNHDFKAFGIYRIILGVIVLLYFYVIK